MAKSAAAAIAAVGLILEVAVNEPVEPSYFIFALPMSRSSSKLLKCTGCLLDEMLRMTARR